MPIDIFLLKEIRLCQEIGHFSSSDVQFLHFMAENGTFSSKFSSSDDLSIIEIDYFQRIIELRKGRHKYWNVIRITQPPLKESALDALIQFSKPDLPRSPRVKTI